MAVAETHQERCEGHGHSHAPVSDVSAMMDRARAFAAARKVPFTEMRARVLTTLASEAKPLTAYEIVDRLSGSKKVQAVQVYRALDFLQEAGCVHRLASRASYFACDHEHHPGEAVVFMVCSNCGIVREAPSDLVAQGLQDAAEHAGFRPVHPIVEMEGECARCLEAKPA